MKRKITIIIVGLLGLALLIQLIPYGRQHDNPPVQTEPVWDSPQTEELARRACYDCHSNEVVWPWYSNVAPVSWLVQRDVDEGRQHLNFSKWAGLTEKDKIPEVVAEGEMPLKVYLIMHSDARLTQAETEALVNGLKATISGK